MSSAIASVRTETAEGAAQIKEKLATYDNNPKKDPMFDSIVKNFS